MSNRLYYWIIGAFALISLVVYIIKPGGFRSMLILSNLIAVIAASIAFISLFNAGRQRDADPRLEWYLLTAGIGLYALGEIFWAIQEVFLGINNPYPSIADFFWLTGYIPLFLGLVISSRRLGIALNRNEILSIGFGSLIILVFSIRILFLPIAASSEIDILEKILDITYPLADILLVIPAVSLVIFLGNSLIGRPWRFIFTGLVFLGVADYLFSYLTWNNIYWLDVNTPGNLTDLLWVAGYLTISIGAIQYKSVVRGKI